MKKIFIIDGHPYHEGLASQLSREYARGAKKGGHEVRVAELRNLKFDPILRYGYRKRTALERDLIIQQENIKWCDHLVVTTPIWWMSLPALLKGFIDRTFLPGFAYSYEMTSYWLKPGLVSGQTAMFFYISHLYLYAIMGSVLPKGCPIELMYALCILGLVMLFLSVVSF